MRRARSGPVRGTPGPGRRRARPARATRPTRWRRSRSRRPWGRDSRAAVGLPRAGSHARAGGLVGHAGRAQHQQADGGDRLGLGFVGRRAEAAVPVRGQRVLPEGELLSFRVRNLVEPQSQRVAHLHAARRRHAAAGIRCHRCQVVEHRDDVRAHACGFGLVAAITQGDVGGNEGVGVDCLISVSGVVPVPHATGALRDRRQGAERLAAHAVDLAVAVGVHEHARHDAALRPVEHGGAPARLAKVVIEGREQPEVLGGVVVVAHAGLVGGPQPCGDGGVGVRRTLRRVAGAQRGLHEHHADPAVIEGEVPLVDATRGDVVADVERLAGEEPVVVGHAEVRVARADRGDAGTELRVVAGVARPGRAIHAEDPSRLAAIGTGGGGDVLGGQVHVHRGIEDARRQGRALAAAADVERPEQVGGEAPADAGALGRA